MFELLKLIPLPLVILSVVLVIVPAIFTALVRVRLYYHLVHLEDRVRRLINRVNRGQIPRIIEDLEERFREASQNLEEVNTAALVDGIYSQEQFDFFGLRWRCNQWDYFSQVLPNLLLSFGLLGTFLGIVINLSTLIQTINQVDASQINSLVEQLQEPLQGMGIAFVTSLIAVACSSLLTVVNLGWNTSLAREDLISSLEDYLDNILQPTIEGNTRLDKAVDRMATQQENFLKRFHGEVAEAVEKSLGRVAQQIAQGNEEAAILARQVYERFTESSGSISNAASKFESVVANFQSAVVNDMRPTVEEFKLVAQTFERSQFPRKLSEATQNLASTQQNFSNSALALEEAVEVIKNALTTLDNNSQSLGKLAAEILNINQTSIEVLNLHRSNQESLEEIIPKLHKGAESFESVVGNIEVLQERIATREESLGDIRLELANLVETLKKNTKEVNSGIQKLGNNLINSIAQKVDVNNKQVQTVAEQFKESVNHLSGIESQLTDLIEKRLFDLVNSYARGSYRGLENLGDRLTNTVAEEVGSRNQQVEAAIAQFQESTNHLSENIENLGDRLTNTVTEKVGTSNQQVRTVVEQLGSNNREIQTLLEQIEESVAHLSAIEYRLDQLESTLRSQVQLPNILKNLFRNQ